MGRVDEEVRREIGSILQQKVRDPRLQWVSVTRVEVSRDLSVAQVHVSTLGDETAKTEVLEALVKAGPFVRAALGRSLHLRRTPELRFHYDRGIEHSLRVNQMLEELGITGSTPVEEKEDPDAAAATSGADDAATPTSSADDAAAATSSADDAATPTSSADDDSTDAEESGDEEGRL